ncbi:MAG TPA: sulfotransferase [Oculatellaceae cyanobacterium]
MKIIYVTGLPRAGSTLLCQLLSHHPDIYCTGHSSPLCQTLMGLRYNLSDSEFLLAQLDVDFKQTYQRLLNAFRGFITGWFAETKQPYVVDKNRGWLQHIQTVNHIDPEFKMLVCVRELGQIYGSIEAKHQQTLLLDFPDHLANLSPYERAEKLFASGGVVGAPLSSIEALQDLDTQLQQHLYYVVFEDLLSEPEAALQGIFQWLGLKDFDVDLQNLQVRPHESDSYYRYKYTHQTYSTLKPPQQHLIPNRIQGQLLSQFTWFYSTFYPGLIKAGSP